MSVIGNIVGGVSSLGKTLIIEDENGNELTGVVTEQEQIFTATDNDVREGSVYAGDAGISTGTKVIPSYHTRVGYKKINIGSSLKITFHDSLDLYDFTKLQIIICRYSDSFANSVQSEKVVIGETLYDVNSTVPISTVTKDPENKTIDLGITNESDTAYILRYFTYKEIY